MKFRCLLVIAVSALFFACATRPQTDTMVCFTGKLVKRGICGQRVIQLISDPQGGIGFAQNWTDSLAHRSYENVFTVGNPCLFPATINEGETFSFSLTNAPDSNCIRCMAFTAVPEQKNNIVVGCTQTK